VQQLPQAVDGEAAEAVAATQGSCGRSIHWWFQLVTTSSTLPQGRPCGWPPAAAVLAPATTRRSPGTGLTVRSIGSVHGQAVCDHATCEGWADRDGRPSV